MGLGVGVEGGQNERRGGEGGGEEDWKVYTDQDFRNKSVVAKKLMLFVFG